MIDYKLLLFKRKLSNTSIHIPICVFINIISQRRVQKVNLKGGPGRMHTFKFSLKKVQLFQK